MVFRKLFFPRRPLLVLTKTTNPHILAHVNIVCPDGRYRKMKNLFHRTDFS